jgi:hypothetical protein
MRRADSMRRYCWSKCGSFRLHYWYDREFKIAKKAGLDIAAAIRQAEDLNTLFDIAGDRTSMIVFPFPMELMQGFSAIAQRG